MFSHGSCHSKGVCISIDPKVKGKIELLFQDNSGRIVLITSQINGLKVSICPKPFSGLTSVPAEIKLLLNR